MDAEQYEGFEAIDMQSFAETWNSSLDGGVLNIQNIDIGGHDFDIWSSSISGEMQMYHWDYWWIFPVGKHYMTWTDKRGTNCGDTLTSEELEANYEVGEAIEFKVSCPHFFVKSFFNFNTTLYDSPTEAWDADALWILVGINFDQAQTGFNAWAVIGMLLFFSLPEIHWFVNALIAIPIWAAIAYISFILLLRAIGAVFGGGGA